MVTPLTKRVSTPAFRSKLRVLLRIASPGKDISKAILPWLLDGPLFQILDAGFAVVTQTFLTFLFLGFMLANDNPSREDDKKNTLSSRVRSYMRSYIRIKTVAAFAVSALCGIFLWRMKVDLSILFAFMTFPLCYVPHIGNTIAVIIPLPLVLLDPEKDWWELLVVFLVPFTVHQLSVNLFEPKLLASSLDLHPIVVLLALAFWSTVWGVAGAVLSVPVTAVGRIMLLEVDHPYAKLAVRLMQGDIGSGAAVMGRSRQLSGFADQPREPRLRPSVQTYGKTGDSQLSPRCPKSQGALRSKRNVYEAPAIAAESDISHDNVQPERQGSDCTERTLAV